MKRLMAVMAATVILISAVFYGCGKKPENSLILTTEPTTQEAPEESQSSTEQTTDNSTASEQESKPKEENTTASQTVKKPEQPTQDTKPTSASVNSNIINGVDISAGSKVDLGCVEKYGLEYSNFDEWFSELQQYTDRDGTQGYLTSGGAFLSADKVNENRISDKKEIEIVKSIISPNMTQLQAVVAINKYICDNFEYDYNGGFDINQYEFFVTKKGLCGNYAGLFQSLVSKCGIKTDYIISGYANSGQGWGYHGWNSVTIDGVIYYVDTTWNDTSNQPTRFLLIKDSTFSGTHKAD